MTEITRGDSQAKPKRRHVVCAATELPAGERRIVEVGRRSIGVFNIAGTFHAIANVCPHQRAPLCKGTLAKTAYADKPDEWKWDEDSCVIRCPWHGWEFDIRSGRSVFNPHRLGVRSYEVAIESQAGGGIGLRTISADEPDPEVKTFDVAVEEQVVVLYI